MVLAHVSLASSVDVDDHPNLGGVGVGGYAVNDYLTAVGDCEPVLFVAPPRWRRALR
jgi:hypothetical protein